MSSVAAVMAIACVVLHAGCSARTDDDESLPADSPVISSQNRRAAIQTSRTFVGVYFNQLQKGLLTPEVASQLRGVTTASVHRQLLRKYRRVSAQRRGSRYARSKLDSRGECYATAVRLIVRTPKLVIADPDYSCGIGWGFELTFAPDGGWRVGSLRDARFDSRGRCVAPSCRPRR